MTSQRILLFTQGALLQRWRGTEGHGRPGEKGAGDVREAGEEEAGRGIPKVVGSRRKMEKLSSTVQNFAIEKMQRQEPTITGQEPGLRGMGSGKFKPPAPPPPTKGLVTSGIRDPH